MKSLIPYILAFIVLVVIAISLGNQDPITPAVVEARSETSVGSVTMDVANQGLSFLAKLLAGATITGALSFLWIEGSRWYRKYRSDQLTRRWKPGPNAQFQQQIPRSRISDKELLLMALAGNGRLPTRTQRMPQINEQTAENEIDIDL